MEAMFDTLKNTVQKLLITPINKKQSPVLEIWDLHMDHREKPRETDTGLTQLTSTTTLAKAQIPSTFSLTHSSDFPNSKHSLKSPCGQQEGVRFYQPQSFPWPCHNTSLRLFALSFCPTSPQHLLQEVTQRGTERHPNAQGRKGKSKLPLAKQEEKDTRLTKQERDWTVCILGMFTWL